MFSGNEERLPSMVKVKGKPSLNLMPNDISL
jgi:hypothetical protein